MGIIWFDINIASKAGYLRTLALLLVFVYRLLSSSPSYELSKNNAIYKCFFLVLRADLQYSSV